MQIRRAEHTDHAAIWRVIEPIIRAGEVFALPRGMSRSDALAFWAAPGNEVFVAEVEGEVLGTISSTPTNRAAGRTWPTGATPRR